MCDNPRLPAAPVYGSNDWYYAYGKNSAEQTLRDADLLAETSSGHAVRPFAVIDMRAPFKAQSHRALSGQP